MKAKSHSGAKKRLSITGKGKFKRKKAGSRHLNLGKANNRLRRLGETAYVHQGDERRMRRLLPNG